MLNSNIRACYAFSFQKRVLKYCAVLELFFKTKNCSKPACSDLVRFHDVYR
jgi:hypothetical protein